MQRLTSCIMSHETVSEFREIDLAIVGLSCRVPGANTPDAFWDNVLGGVESIVDVDPTTLRARGVDEETLLHPRYVARTACMDDVEGFDAGFFGFSAVDAAIADPQHRHFLECAWEAMESAGHAPDRFKGRVGVFAGSGMHAYFTYHLAPNTALMGEHGLFLIRHTANDKDFLATRVSYAMNLRGPSVNVQTACSTSLVAVHMGCQSLLSMESDFVLCGGVTIELPHGVGYRYQPGEILSADGRCRALDASADGTVFGSGAGVVAIRRLQDALDDGDPIRAVIRATAINNDGHAKVGYLAPSVDGQAAVIAEAIELAEVTTDEVGYVELHGTGTPVGDPIELAALRQVFGAPANGRPTCRIGSVKPNIGHLDTAAGVASLIKAVGMLERRQFAPSLHVSKPNPALELEGSAFQVATRPEPWDSEFPRRIGVNSIGVGGTNAHAILQEAPATPVTPLPDRTAWLPISAKSPEALTAACQRLADWCAAHPNARLADIAYTLQEGRTTHALRAGVLTRTLDEAQRELANLAQAEHTDGAVALEAPQQVWAFAGGGAQFAGMAAEPYANEPVFRDAFNDALDALTGPDREEIHRLATTPRSATPDADDQTLERPSLALPALLATQVATARWLLAHGVSPDVLIGHSMGEYTAAHLAGVFSLRDVMRLVRTRGELFEQVPRGAMLSVPMPASALAERLPAGVDLAADNASELSLASGPVAAIEALQTSLAADGVEARRVPIDVAAHSSMLEPILGAFRSFVASIPRSAPHIAVVSNLTGARTEPDQLTSVDYWVRHLRETVRFGTGVGALLSEGAAVLTEVGPGRTLSTLAQMNAAFTTEHRTVTTLGHRRATLERGRALRRSVGALWSAGAAIDPHALRGPESLRRLALPTYPFQHQRYWFDRPSVNAAAGAAPGGPRTASAQKATWWVPAWHPWTEPPREVPPSRGPAPSGVGVVLHDGSALADAMVAALAAVHVVVVVQVGASLERKARNRWTCPLHTPSETGALVERLLAAHGHIHTLFDFWTQAAPGHFDAVLARARALQSVRSPLTWALVTERGAALPGDASISAEAALLHGTVPVLNTELDTVHVVALDVASRSRASSHVDADRLLAAATAGRAPLYAIRDGAAYERRVASASLPAHRPVWASAPGDVFVFTGGLGGMAAALATALAEQADGVTIELWSRTAMPARSAWPTLRGELARRARRVQAIEAAGATVTLRAVDVTDEAAVLAAFAAAQAAGRVRGVVHAAGVLDDGLLDARTPERVAAVLAPKRAGARAIQAACLAFGEHVDWVVLCASHSAFAGLAGQADYAAANAFLDAVAHEPFGPSQPRVHAIAWPAWSDAGMAADALANLRAELGTEAAYPWLGRDTSAAGATRRFRRAWSASEDWPLDQHRLRGGLAVLPGTMFVCLAAAATREQLGAATELLDVMFVEPFAVADDRPRVLEVRVDGDAQRWHAASSSPDGDEIIHAQGRFRPLSTAGAPDHDEADDVGRAWQIDNDGPRRDPFVAFGPRWGVAPSIWGDRERAVVHLRSVPNQPGLVSHAAVPDPAVLDVATGSAQRLAGIDPERVFLIPVGYERVQLFAPIEDDARSVIRCTRRLDGTSTAAFSIAVRNPDGACAALVEGFTMRAVEVHAVSKSAASAYASVDDATANLERAIRDGVTSAEGAKAFLSLVAHGGPRQLILAKGAPVLPASATSPLPSATQATEAMAGARTPTEQAIAAIWVPLIGGAAADIHTDFFSSGGHSLNAIRLIARINDALGVALPVRTLFEHPTIAGLAAAVESARAIRATPSPAHDEATAHVSSHTATASPREGTQRLTAAQRGIWFVDQLQGGNRGYHVCGAFEIRGPLELPDLDAALLGVISDHETLRSRFVAVAGEPTVAFNPIPDHVLEVHNWPGDAGVASALNRLAALPFDLQTGPLFRAHLLTDGVASHALLVVQHHIVSDEWSLEALVDELSQRYTAHRDGALFVRSGPVFGDLQELDPAPASAATRDYWRDALAGASYATPFPTDRPRPRVATTTGARHVAVLADETSAAIRAFARREGVTLFSAMLAAYEACVAAWCRTDDLIVATPASLRQTADAETVLGCLVGTAILRADLADNPTYRSLVLRTRDAVLNAFDRHRIALDELVRLVDPPSDPSRGRMFQTMFALFPVKQQLRLGDASARAIHVDAGGSQVDLTCYVADDGEALEVITEYNTDLFEQGTIARFVARLDAWIAAVAADPDVPIGALAPLPPGERAMLEQFEQGPTRRIARDASPLSLVLKQASRTPSHLAVSDTSSGLTYTYAALVDAATSVATNLHAHGVRPGDLVGVSVARDARLPALLLGVWMAGAAYVPLDPSFPSQRLTEMADDAGLRLLVAARDHADRFAEAFPACCVDDVFSPSDAQRSGALRSPARPPKGEDLAYVIYTSGSTGRPKGVKVPHRAVANFLRSMARRPGLSGDDALLAVTTISFDISVLELFGPLSTGGTVCVADTATAGDPHRLAAAIDAHRITVLQATPATWRLLALADWRGPTVRALCGGEPLPADLARELLDRVSALWNLYGPTEATVWSTTERVTDAGEITIGVPIDNTTIHLLGAHGQRVPIGTPGRLFIGGLGVASGYHRRQVLSASRFVANPFVPDGSSVMYDTGDWASWRSDGRLVFASRSDDQVKVRGFRIELGDVESAIGVDAEVDAVAVAVWSPTAGDTRLVAYVVSDAEHSVIRDRVRARLPDYMVPSLWISMDALPMTPNLKLDRKRLPKPELVADGSSASALSTARERWLARVWMSALGTGTLGPQSNFFDSGGHSLLAMQVLHTIESETGVRINPLELSLQTLGQLAALLPEPADHGATRQ